MTIQDFSFKPADITVQAGSEITWTNEDSAEHTATADDLDVFDTGSIRQGERGTATFEDIGTLRYHCAIHPNMRGSITVE